MEAYIYQAALLCEPCALKIMQNLPKPEGCNPDDEHTYDSDDYPKGPYADGGGEADYPCHCNDCNVFLCNPLTSCGMRYVLQCFREWATVRRGRFDVLEEWADFYDLPLTFTYSDLKYEVSVHSDPWGTCMEARFAVAGELHARGEHIPDAWRYRPGVHPIDPDNTFAAPLACASTEDVERFGAVLARYARRLEFLGMAY